MNTLTASLLLKVCLEVSAWEYVDQQDIDSAAEVCLDVAQEAQAQKQPVHYMIALAWAESRFTSGLSARAKKRRAHESDLDWRYRKRWRIAQGPLQVIPWWHCRAHRKTDTVEDCDLVKAGVEAFKKFAAYTSSHEETVCYYNCYHPMAVDKQGKRYKRACSPSSAAWAKGVSKDAARVKAIMNRLNKAQKGR